MCIKELLLYFHQNLEEGLIPNAVIKSFLTPIVSQNVCYTEIDW